MWACLATSLFAAGQATHVVVVVWDGMRPDFVSEKTTPVLFKLAAEGVTFDHHHCAYISSTEVNGAVLATGVYPEHNGIIGNREFRPAIDPTNRIMTAELRAVRRGDGLSGNHFLGFATLAETLHARGLRTAVAGAKTVTLLQDRNAQDAAGLGVDVFEGDAVPPAILKTIERALGKFPPVSLPKLQRDAWTTRALTGPLWDPEVPPFSLLWLSEPDFSQHETGPGSPTALAALKSSDDNLGRLLGALEAKGLRDQTDVIVVSDHGFSTISENIDLAAILRTNGFHAGREFASANPQPGQILVVGNGGTVFLYVAGHDAAFIGRLAHFLQTQPFCGVVFSRVHVEGTFPLVAARINSPDAPDLALSMHWRPDRSTNGTPGLVCSDYGQYGPGGGMHASLSPFDLHNTGIAAGPDFRRGSHDPLPTGNIDIAPTVLYLLGVKPRARLDGRVLTEALVSANAPEPSVTPRHLEASYRGDNFTWHQYLNSWEVNGVVYFDEGDGSRGAAGKPAGN